MASVSSRTLRALKFNLCLALIVWTAWFAIGQEFAMESVLKNWRVSLTMVFGSLVGGGTSEGGGAVAFPVFTKILHIPPEEARLFALAIQSVGMGAASLSILYLRIPIERRVLLWAGSAGIVGIAVSTFLIAPFVVPMFVRIIFTIMVACLGISLVIMRRGKRDLRHEQLALFGPREKFYIVLAGFAGGIMSGLVGCGENIVTFMTLVLLFRLNEKIATPTTVILMALVSICGFAMHVFIVQDFTPVVQGYWLAAVPVVVVGAPLGALLCSRMSKATIVNILLFLISLEVISTVALIPMTPPVILTALATLAACVMLNMAMCRTKLYCPSRF